MKTLKQHLQESEICDCKLEHLHSDQVLEMVKEWLQEHVESITLTNEDKEFGTVNYFYCKFIKQLIEELEQ